MKSMKWISVAVLLAAAGSAWSAPVLTLSGPGSITAGQSFDLTMQLTGVTGADHVNGISFFLQQAGGGSTKNAFTITAWDHTATPFDDPNAVRTSDIVNKAIPSIGNTADLGGSTSDLSVVPDGDYTVGVLTLHTSSAMEPGQYIIRSVNAFWLYPDVTDDGNPLSASAPITVVAVPEPTCLGLAGAAGLLMLGRRERRAEMVCG